jgi:hypothetical protein
MIRKLPVILWCFAFGITSFVLLDYWSQRNAPLAKRFESLWREDVEQLEASKKLPAPWNDIRDLEVFAGTSETREWLNLITVPLHSKKDGHFRLEVLLVAWEEDGKRGVLVQYDLVDLKTKNNIWELGRTLILHQ